MEEMRESKLPEPEFKNYSGGFAVILWGPGKSFEKRIEKEKLHILFNNGDALAEIYVWQKIFKVKKAMR